MAVSDVLKKAFPFISMAASLGGPLGVMAANAVGTALGVDKVQPSNLPDVIATAMANPDQLAAMKKAEQDFQVQMTGLGYQHEDLEAAVDEKDRESARAREVSVRDYTPEIGFYLLLLIFASVIHWVLKWPVPGDNQAIVYSAIGSLGTLVVMAATYFYGTTRGSETKGQTIADTTTALMNKVSGK